MEANYDLIILDDYSGTAATSLVYRAAQANPGDWHVGTGMLIIKNTPMK